MPSIYNKDVSGAINELQKQKKQQNSKRQPQNTELSCGKIKPYVSHQYWKILLFM